MASGGHAAAAVQVHTHVAVIEVFHDASVSDESYVGRRRRSSGSIGLFCLLPYYYNISTKGKLKINNSSETPSNVQ
jgi:hypothetical protein